MATNYTTLLGLAQPTTGELAGTWGDTVNNYITTYLDAAIAGAQVLTTDADATLTKTTGAALTATSSQYAILNCTGARTAARNITVPAAYKVYVVINATTGGFAVTIRGAGPTAGVSIANGEEALVAWNGGDFVVIATNNLSNGGIIGTLPVARGGTGLATLTANNVLLGNGTSAVQVVAPSTSGNVLTSNGTTWSSAALPTVYTSGKQLFTTGTAATWAVPTGVTTIKVTVVGGGGSNTGYVSCTGSAWGGAGAGGTAVKWYTVVAGQNVTYTVGAAGGTTSATYGGVTVSATGGASTGAGAANGGSGGAGSGGDINMNGQAGSPLVATYPANSYFSGEGGSTPYGTGGPARSGTTGATTGTGYGAGASGQGFNSIVTGTVSGTSGIVIIEY